jgi:oxygen-independent coproporphyrinogen-3 oxidase
LLPVPQLKTIIDAAFSVAGREHIEEVTIEVNPDDVTENYACGIYSLGVNRVSIGIQSFVDSELAAINRRHNAAQAVEAVKCFKQAGIANISIDLIFGLPGQTLDSLAKSLDVAIALDVQHISVYNLTYEEGTRLWVMREKGTVHETDEETVVKMYDLVRTRLAQAGFEHYEISNFAKPGFRSKHNSNYWNGTPYLGLGAAAHSFDGRQRMYNCSNLKQYLEKTEGGEVAFTAENEAWWERYDEMVMVRLRTSDGLDLGQVERAFGSSVGGRLQEKANAFVSQGLLKRHGRTLCLSEKGVLVSDYIIRELMWDA